LFQLKDLSVAYRSPTGPLPVVGALALGAMQGRVVGIAGESGSGKTTAVLAAIGFLPAGAVRTGGAAILEGTSLFEIGPAARRRLWATRISYVAQDAASSLNPAYRLGAQIRELLQVNRGMSRAEAHAEALALFAAVRLPEPQRIAQRYPHECSGGQLQRAAIALALACEPRLIVFDEPTTGLDVTTQAELVEMLGRLIRERDIAALYISHDLALLGQVSDQLLIMYAGEVVEQGPTNEILSAPRHPYTRALLDALPSARRLTRPVGLAGVPPGRVITGSCAFAPRCPHAVPACLERNPELLSIGSVVNRVRCLRAYELGPLVRRAGDALADRVGHVAEATQPLVSIADLRCSYGQGAARVEAVSGVSLDIAAGETVALVGESGSGKSTIGRALVGLVAIEGGEISLDGAPLDASGKRTRAQRQAIQIIFQNPDSSLNPRHTVRQLVGRSLELFRPELSGAERRAELDQILGDVRLDPMLSGRYPSQLSGGQKQRVAIARAFVARPRLVICDEIVSGQDVSVQATILELVRTMQQQYGTALLFISHDLAVVRSIAQRVYVVRSGRNVESGPPEQLFEEPRAAYTRALLAAVMEPAGAIEAAHAS